MRTASSALLGLLALATSGSAGADLTKVAVAPFAGLTGDVPQRAGTKVATLLFGELKNVGTLEPVAVPVEANEAASKSLQDARDAVTEADGLKKKRKFGAAASALKKAIAAYDAGSALVADPTELSDAHTALGTVLYLTGDDVGGAKELWNALTLTPSRPLPGESTSPLFTATVKKIRERVFAAEKGQLQISSVPTNAPVLLDGQEVGRTPIALKDIPPGKHLWQVLLPTSEPQGGALMLASGQSQKVAAVLSGSAPVTQLNVALSQNKLDEGAVAAARKVAASVGAELLVFGGLHARGQDLVLESFLYSSTKNALTRLPQKTFDSELLSAGMELFKVAGDIGGRTGELGAPEKVPAKVTVEVTPAENASITEVAYALPGEKLDEKKEEVRGPRRPVDPTKATTTKQLRKREK